MERDKRISGMQDPKLELIIDPRKEVGKAIIRSQFAGAIHHAHYTVDNKIGGVGKIASQVGFLDRIRSVFYLRYHLTPTEIDVTAEDEYRRQREERKANRNKTVPDLQGRDI